MKKLLSFCSFCLVCLLKKKKPTPLSFLPFFFFFFFFFHFFFFFYIFLKKKKKKNTKRIDKYTLGVSKRINNTGPLFFQCRSKKCGKTNTLKSRCPCFAFASFCLEERLTERERERGREERQMEKLKRGERECVMFESILARGKS